MTDQAEARMKEKLSRRVNPAAKAPEIPAGEVRLPENPKQLRWLEREKGVPFMLTHDGVFCIEGSRVNGEAVYTAWKRSTLYKWLLGSGDVIECRRLCDLAIDEVGADVPRYNLETDLTRYAQQLATANHG